MISGKLKIKVSKLVVTFAATLLLGMLAASTWFYLDQRPPTDISVPDAHWVHIFFRGINRITDLAEVKQLRNVHVNNGDVEVRIWRGAFLGSTEGVFLKRVAGHWSGQHLMVKTGNSYDDLRTEVTTLDLIKPAWEQLWNGVVEKGLLTLPGQSETNCNQNGIDEIVYVVEINQGNSYRTYMYIGGPCPEWKQIDEIGEILGAQFDKGERQCQGDEWFACMTKRRLEEETPR